MIGHPCLFCVFRSADSDSDLLRVLDHVARIDLLQNFEITNRDCTLLVRLSRRNGILRLPSFLRGLVPAVVLFSICSIYAFHRKVCMRAQRLSKCACSELRFSDQWPCVLCFDDSNHAGVGYAEKSGSFPHRQREKFSKLVFLEVFVTEQNCSVACIGVILNFHSSHSH